MRTLIFLHMPKTGGTALATGLRSLYGPTERYDPIYQEPKVAPEKLSAADRARIRCAIGHFKYGIHEHLTGPCAYLTMLREPVERILSQYSYLKTTPGFEWVRDTPFLDYLDIRLQARDDQTRRIAGNGTTDFDLACENLRHFAAVGTTERWTESIAHFSRVFAWPPITFKKVNVTANRLRREELSPTELDAVIDRNRIDIRLHAFASELLTEGILRAGAKP